MCRGAGVRYVIRELNLHLPQREPRHQPVMIQRKRFTTNHMSILLRISEANAKRTDPNV